MLTVWLSIVGMLTGVAARVLVEAGKHPEASSAPGVALVRPATSEVGESGVANGERGQPRAQQVVWPPADAAPESRLDEPQEEFAARAVVSQAGAILAEQMVPRAPPRVRASVKLWQVVSPSRAPPQA